MTAAGSLHTDKPIMAGAELRGHSRCSWFTVWVDERLVMIISWRAAKPKGNIVDKETGKIVRKTKNKKESQKQKCNSTNQLGLGVLVGPFVVTNHHGVDMMLQR